MNNKLFNKNFILILLGQTVSMFGTITAISILPMIFLSPIGGVLCDRVNRRNLMIILDLSYAFISFLLIFFLKLENTIFIVSVVMILISVIASFETPTVQSSIPLIHTKENYVKANAAISQISMLSNFLGPIIGGFIYASIKINTIMLITSICFFIAVILEIFIKIPFIKQKSNEKISKIIISDTKLSLDFLTKEEPFILKLLFQIALINLFVSAFFVVGIPFIIRITLGLSSRYNGFLQGISAFSGIIGAVLAGLCSSKIKNKNLYFSFVFMGISFIPLFIVFFINQKSIIIYSTLLLVSVILQIISSFLSIILLSIIQERTPENIIGKVMSYIIAISTSMLPIGQLMYGFLFEQFPNKIYLIVLMISISTVVIGFMSKKVFCFDNKTLKN